MLFRAMIVLLALCNQPVLWALSSSEAEFAQRLQEERGSLSVGVNRWFRSGKIKKKPGQPSSVFVAHGFAKMEKDGKGGASLFRARKKWVHEKRSFVTSCQISEKDLLSALKSEKDRYFIYASLYNKHLEVITAKLEGDDRLAKIKKAVALLDLSSTTFLMRERMQLYPEFARAVTERWKELNGGRKLLQNLRIRFSEVTPSGYIPQGINIAKKVQEWVKSLTHFAGAMAVKSVPVKIKHDKWQENCLNYFPWMWKTMKKSNPRLWGEVQHWVRSWEKQKKKIMSVCSDELILLTILGSNDFDFSCDDEIFVIMSLLASWHSSYDSELASVSAVGGYLEAMPLAAVENNEVVRKVYGKIPEVKKKVLKKAKIQKGVVSEHVHEVFDGLREKLQVMVEYNMIDLSDVARECYEYVV